MDTKGAFEQVIYSFGNIDIQSRVRPLEHYLTEGLIILDI